MSMWNSLFTLSCDESERRSEASALFSPTDDSLFYGSQGDASGTADILGRLNYLRVPRPAPCLTIPTFQGPRFNLVPAHQRPSCESNGTPAAESIWTPFGLPQGTGGVSFNVYPESEGISRSPRELLSTASTDQRGESFILDATEVVPHPHLLSPTSILVSATPKKGPSHQPLHQAESEHVNSPSDSCGGSGLHAVRQLRASPAAPPPNSAPPPPQLFTHQPSTDTSRARRSPPQLRRVAASEAPAAPADKDGASIPSEVPTVNGTLGRRRRASRTHVPVFAAHTPMYSAVLGQGRCHRLPRGPAFFPAWSARNTSIPQLPEELLYEDAVNSDDEECALNCLRVLMQQSAELSDSQCGTCGHVKASAQ